MSGAWERQGGGPDRPGQGAFWKKIHGDSCADGLVMGRERVQEDPGHLPEPLGPQCLQDRHLGRSRRSHSQRARAVVRKACQGVTTDDLPKSMDPSPCGN